MSVKPIYNCFHPVLKKNAENIREFDQELQSLIADLYDTMYGADNGIGLAAPQIGVSKKVLVIDVNAGDIEQKFHNTLTMINPEIIEFSDDSWTYQEGCLSVPTLYENVVRPKEIKVKYYDENMKEHFLEADELLSRVIQHEVDHLNGVLFFERVSPVKRTLMRSKLKKIQKGKILGTYPMVLPNGETVE